MTAVKLITLIGMLAKSEASYGAGGSLSTSTDGILLPNDAEIPVKLEYAFDGSRPMGPGTGGAIARTTPKGRIASFQVPILARGAGAAYSASVLPKDLDIWLRAAGRKRVIDTTVGAENVTYTPSSLKTDWASFLAGGYTGEQLWSFLGGYCAASWQLDGAGFLKFMFDTKAIISALPTDAAVPAITYQSPTTVLPPVTENMVVNIGAYTAPIVYKASWKDGRTIVGPRKNVVAPGGIAGFGLSIKRKEQFTVTIERTALVGSPYNTVAGLDPYNLRDRATNLAFQVQLGTTGNYNVVQHTANNCQIVDIAEDKEDPTGLWTLTLEAHPSSPTADDDSTIAFLK